MVNHADKVRDSKFAALLKDGSGPRYSQKLRHEPGFRDDWQQRRKCLGFSKKFEGHRNSCYSNGGYPFVQAVKFDRGSHHRSNNLNLHHHHILDHSLPTGNVPNGKFHSHERSGWNVPHLSDRIQGHGRGGHSHRGNGRSLNWMHRNRSFNYGNSSYRHVVNPLYHNNGRKFHIHDQRKEVNKAGTVLGCFTRAGSKWNKQVVTSTNSTDAVNLHDVQPADLPKNSVSDFNVEHIKPSTHNTQTSSPARMEQLPSTSKSEDVTLYCQSSLLLQIEGSPAEEDAALPLMATSICFKRDRAFITCRDNKKRPRSSAVRDYPAGCGKQLMSVKKSSSACRNLEVVNEETGPTNLCNEAVPLDIFPPGPKASIDESDMPNVDGEPGTAANGIQVFLDSLIGKEEDDASKLSRYHVGVSNQDTLLTSDANEVFAMSGSEIMFKSSSIENSNKADDFPDLVQSDGGFYHGNTIERRDLLGVDDAGVMIETPPLRNSCELVLEDSHVLVDYGCDEEAKSPSDLNSNREHAPQGQVRLTFKNASGTMMIPAQTASQEDRDSILKKREGSPKVDVQVANTSSRVTLGHDQSDNPAAGLISSSRLNNGDEMPKAPQNLEISENTGCSMKIEDSKQVFRFSENAGALVPYQSSRNRAMKKKDPKQGLEISGNVGALVPYQSNKTRTNGKHNDSGRRLIHKGNTRLKIYQDSRSLDGGMLLDLEKALRSEAEEGVSARTLVKRTLQEFESLRKMLVKSQDGVKDGIKRADLDAGGIMKKRGKWRNCGEKIVGEVPGVEVGDQFSFRMEMLIIGLHRQVQAGIDYIPASRRGNKAPLATSIVASGGYEDDKDDGNVLIYTGQGGKSNKGVQGSNQELVRGNLALSISMEEKTPVRVIRGTPDQASPSSRVYTYDGLYDVVGLRFEYGASGYQVFHFTLIRRPGQPQVGLSFLSSLKRKGIARPHLLLDDISQGQERLPVCVVNEVDGEPAPLHFVYTVNMKYPLWYLPLMPQGCDCVGGCFDEEKCSCAHKNGGEFPYNDDGYIIRDKKVVFECGSSCRCSSSCQNRVSQKGLRYRLEIFKTKNRGWGVRSLNSIQSGGFICEYTGELLSDAEAEKRVENDEYLFDLGHECNPSSAPDVPAGLDLSNAIVPVLADVAYTIDAKDMGNVARFINHSCSPNLYAQNVLYESNDLRFPHVMLFAMENIPPMRELTYDYNYSFDQVRDAHGNVKTKACYCGAQDCKGRLY